MNVYDFEVKDIFGKNVSLREYAGKVLLIINSATHCGFTAQYNDLEALYAAYRDAGFEILDFPCNQFGGQAPGTEAEISTFCRTRFGIAFPQFAKVDVNGPNACPLFTWLKEQKGFAGFDRSHPLAMPMHQTLLQADPDYEKKPDIKWNFTKFLIDRSGNVVARFEPIDSLAAIEDAINELL